MTGTLSQTQGGTDPCAYSFDRGFGAKLLIPIKMETVVLIDELVCEEISLSNIRKELDKDLGMKDSVDILTEFMCNLLSEEQ